MLGKFIVVVPIAPEEALHDTLEKAEKEAERLCRKEKRKAYVIRVVGQVEPKEAPLEWRRVEAL